MKMKREKQQVRNIDCGHAGAGITVEHRNGEPEAIMRLAEQLGRLVGEELARRENNTPKS